MFSNLKYSPFPTERWKDNLSQLPSFSFRTLYVHFTERTVQEVISGQEIARGDDTAAIPATFHASDSVDSAVPAEVDDEREDDEGEDDEEDGDSGTAKYSSFRGIDKGFRFFKSGHIQRIQFNSLPVFPQFCFVRCVALPSFRKDRKYNVRICCTAGGVSHVPTVLTAYCTCPAGLAGSCNHIAGLLYALEDFVRLGLHEEAAKACTEKLMQ